MGARPAGLGRVAVSVLSSMLGALAPVAPAWGVTLEVRGRVLDGRGAPARGAIVELRPLETHYEAALAAWSGDVERSPSAGRFTTGDDGAFLVAVPEPGLWKIAVTHEGHVPAEYPLAPLQEPRELPEIHLARDAGLEIELTLPASPDPLPTGRVWVEIAPDADERSVTSASWRTARRYAILDSSSGANQPTPSAPATASSTGSATRDPSGPTPSLGQAGDASIGATATRRLRLPRRAGEKITVRAAVRGAFGETTTSSAHARVALEAAAARFVVRVTQHDAQPLARALVLLAEIGVPIAMTDESGRAPIAVSADDPIELVVLTPEGRLRSFDVRASDRARGEVVLALPRPHVLRGTVVDDADGRPIAGARLWTDARWRGAPERVPDAVLGDVGAVATSRTDGAFELPSVRGVQARAASPGYFVHDVLSGLAGGPFGQPPPGPDEVTIVRLRRSSALGGVVVTEAGEPVARALVVLTAGPGAATHSRATTDAAGRFRIAPVGGGGRLRVVVLAESFAPSIEWVEVPETGGRSDLRLVVRRGRVARGRVTDLEGRPVLGARVRFADASARGFSLMRLPQRFETSPPLLVATAAEGVFALAGVAAGTYDVTVDAAGYAITSVPGLVIPAGEGGDVDLGTLLVGPGVTIEGIVVDGDGGPLAGAAVEARGDQSFARVDAQVGAAPWSAWTRDDGARPSNRSATSAEDGRFVFSDLNPAEKLDLNATLDGYVPATAPRVSGPTEQPVRIVLERAGGIAGRVVDEEGEGVSNARLTAVAVDTGKTVHVRVDPEGEFEEHALPPASYRVEATAQGYEAVESPPVVSVRAGDVENGVRVVLREKERGEIDGRVVDEDGAGVPQARVSVMGARANATTGAEGEFHLESVPVGTHQIVATAPPGRRATKSLEVREGLNTVEITLERGVEVSGRVVDQEGAPVAGAMVSLQQQRGSQAPFATASGGVFMWRAGGNGTTDPEGAFVLTEIADGAYELSASKNGYARTRFPGELRVAGAAISGIELVLEKGGSIRGELRGLDFDQLSQVTVFARSEGPPAAMTGVVSGGAEYVVGDLEAGEWHVVGDVRGHGLHAEGRVAVEAGAEARLDLDFEAGITLSGQVTRRGRPAPGAFLVLRGLDVAGGRNEVADHEGRFRFQGLDEGTYELRAQGGRDNASVPSVQRLELHDDLEVSIEIGGARLTGMVIDAESGEPLRDATVLLRRTSEDEQRLFFAPQRKTGAGGDFVFDEVPEGSYLLEAGKERYANAELALDVAATTDREGLVLELEPSGGLELRVMSAVGPPGWVYAMVQDRGGRPVVGPLRLTASPTGAFVVTGAAEGAWEVLVSAPGLATVRADATVPGPPVDVLLPLSARLTIEIPGLLGGSGVALVEIFDATGRRFVPLGSGAFQPLQRIENGRGHVDGLPPGQWRLRATSLAGGAWSGVASTSAGAETLVRLE